MQPHQYVKIIEKIEKVIKLLEKNAPQPPVEEGNAKPCVHPSEYIKSIRVCGLCGKQL